MAPNHIKTVYIIGKAVIILYFIPLIYPFKYATVEIVYIGVVELQYLQ